MKCNKSQALLKGLLRCGCCRQAMTPSYVRKRNRQYHYYVCSRAQKEGWSVCSVKSVPAGEIERHVLAQIEIIGRRPEMQDRILAAAGTGSVEEEQRREALSAFYPVWESMTKADQARLLNQLCESITFDGEHLEIVYRSEVVGLLELESEVVE